MLLDENIESTRRVLAEDIKKYVEIILKEYGESIPKSKRKFLEKIRDYYSIIIVEDNGTISMFATSTNIIMPLVAYDVFEMLRARPEYGSDKTHRCYTDGEILNQTDYFGYIKHAILVGMSVEEFFRDTALHETMHFCGAGGANALKEGFTELKTRELAQKHNLKASRCGYFKEVEIAMRFQNLIGNDVANRITFAIDDWEIYSILEKRCGEKIANLYFDISHLMDEEHNQKYNHSEFGGLDGPMKKAQAYARIDYSKVYELLKMFEEPNINCLNSDGKTMESL